MTTRIALHSIFKVGSLVEINPKVTVQSKDTYREGVILRAGWIGGLRPRPDTYNISGEVTYDYQGKDHYRQINLNVSVFPSLGSMLTGTLFGSILGTMIKPLLKPETTEFASVAKEMGSAVPGLLANLIIAFIIAIILMRKKDVQPFLTIEDFWGEILVGFLVGYTGEDIIKNLPNILSQGIGSGDSGGNSTG